MIFWPLKPFPTEISCYGCNIIEDEDNPKFSLTVNLNKFRKPYIYGREAKKEKGKVQIQNFYF